MNRTSHPVPRIAVVGAGLIGRTHVALAKAEPSLQLVAVADPTPAAKALADSVGVAWHESLESLLANETLDGVVLATPNELHEPQTLQCLERGLSVLIEKPIAATIDAAQRIVQAAERAALAGRSGTRAGAPARVLVGHHRAHSPIMSKACEVVNSGALGRVVAITGTAMFLKPDHYFVDGPWRAQLGGGPILINLIHEIHNLRMLAGEIESVQAMSSHATRGFAVEDTVALSFRFASGALGSFMLSDTAASARSWEMTSAENKAYPHHEDEDCYLVAGTLGSLAIPTLRLRRYAKTEDRSWWKPFESTVVDVKRTDPLAEQMAHFAEVLRGACEPLVTAREAMVNLQVIEAVREAVREDTTVRLGASG
jgi:predicted dehydrogenase